MSRYFKPAETACRCCGESHMDTDFMTRLDTLRERMGVPLILSSAYRCPEHNSRVSTTGPKGPHTTGRAVDILAGREFAFTLVRVAISLGFTGIGIKGRGTVRFVHLDDLEEGRPRLWSY